jgi:hypothetical protein
MGLNDRFEPSWERVWREAEAGQGFSVEVTGSLGAFCAGLLLFHEFIDGGRD